jgi:hypothetical protein
VPGGTAGTVNEVDATGITAIAGPPAEIEASTE